MALWFHSNINKQIPAATACDYMGKIGPNDLANDKSSQFPSINALHTMKGLVNSSYFICPKSSLTANISSSFQSQFQVSRTASSCY